MREKQTNKQKPQTDFDEYITIRIAVKKFKTDLTDLQIKSNTFICKC